jgi:hypothetical protein
VTVLVLVISPVPLILLAVLVLPEEYQLFV